MFLSQVQRYLFEHGEKVCQTQRAHSLNHAAEEYIQSNLNSKEQMKSKWIIFPLLTMQNVLAYVFIFYEL